jgi:hypothetical protein
MLVIPVNRVVDPKRIIGKRGKRNTFLRLTVKSVCIIGA